MKLNLLILTAVIALSLGLAVWLQNSPPSSAPLPAPEIREAEQTPQFTFADISGNKHALSDYAGKNIILNFWASWCAPCIIEFPHLLSFAAGNPDIILIALSSDKNAVTVENFLKRLPPVSQAHLGKTNVIIGLDPDQAITGGLFQTVSLPETILIGPQQELKGKIVGPVDSRADLQNMLHRDR